MDRTAHIRKVAGLALLLALAGAGPASAQGPPSLEMEAPAVVLRGVAAPVRVAATDPLEAPLAVELTWVPVKGEAVWTGMAMLNPRAPAATLDVVLPRAGRGELVLSAGGWETSQSLVCLPGWVSLLPPLLAIVLALAMRSVIPALFAGVWVGAFLVSGFNPWAGLLRTLDTYILGALADADHAAVIIFSMMMGGMVGVMSRSAGTAGIVRALAPLARSRRSAQIATWFVGIVVFFDDYANALIVGNTMRPVTDRLRVSREKLAYIVDSTAAPVVSLAVVSSWIGFEVGLIGDAFKAAGYDQNAYIAFLASIPYRFYPLLALWLVLLVAWTGRDLGPMARAERRAYRKGLLLDEGAEPLADAESQGMQAEEGAEPRWWNAVAPIAVVIVASFAGLWITGRAEVGAEAGLRDVFGAADPFKSLLWASLLGVLTAMGLALGQRILTLPKTLEAWLTGVKAMTLAMLVLLLAWSIGQVTNADLHAADYLSGVISEALDPRFLPAVTFVLAAGIAFATGTSWGTMGILMPLVIPVSLQLTAGMPEAAQWPLLMGTISSVLAGAVFGDHCSPISDTTVLSSMASACDHMDHVRTQIPYALLAGATGLVLGDLATAFLPHPAVPYLALAAGGALLWGVLRWRGRRAEEEEDEEEPPPPGDE